MILLESQNETKIGVYNQLYKILKNPWEKRFQNFVANSKFRKLTAA